MRLSLISFLSFLTITVSLGEDVVRDGTLKPDIENENTISPIKERSPARTNSRNSYFQSFNFTADSSQKKTHKGFTTSPNSITRYVIIFSCC